MMVRNLLKVFGVFAGLLINTGAHALDAAGLTRSVERFMAGYADNLLARHGRTGRIEYSVPALDPRLSLADCASPLQFEPREQGQFSARINLQVTCNSGNSWSVYVPVDMNVWQRVVIAARPIARGQDIGAGDVRLGEMNTSRLNGQYLTSLDKAVGMNVRRPIAQGGALLMEQLEAPLLIKRGELVTISAQTGVVAVKMQGTALSDGRRGEQIRIKNQATSKIVQAEVVAPGLAAVPM